MKKHLALSSSALHGSEESCISNTVDFKMPHSLGVTKKEISLIINYSMPRIIKLKKNKEIKRRYGRDIKVSFKRDALETTPTSLGCPGPPSHPVPCSYHSMGLFPLHTWISPLVTFAATCWSGNRLARLVVPHI